MPQSEPTSASPSDLDEVLDLIVREQARRERHVPSLGTQRDGVLAELEELEPSWTDTLRVSRDRSRLVGAALADWDATAGRAWLHGPWVDADDTGWIAPARALVAAVESALPATVRRRTLTATVEHAAMASLAADLGWVAGEVNLVLSAAEPVVDRWPEPARAVRLAAPSDLERIRSLHDAEFPATYSSAEELVAEAGSEKSVVVVAEDDRGRVTGYAAGRVQPDGDGYLDFVAVDPSARGAGTGRDLVVSLARRVVPATSTRRLCLTVQEGRAAARALYEALGFVTEMAMVGFEPPER